MPTVHARTSLAMRIAGIDRIKFNEIVNDGFYPCAPTALRGSTRTFTAGQLLGLYVLGRLLDIGLRPRDAGKLACDFQREATLPANKDVERVVYIRGRSGLGQILVGDEFDPDLERKGKGIRGMNPMILTLEFQVGNIRRLIAEAIEEERSIIGEEDEE